LGGLEIHRETFSLQNSKVWHQNLGVGYWWL